MGKLRFKQKPYIILMVLVGLFIAGIYILAYGPDIMSSPLWQVIYSILITIMIWTGCVWIVRFLWKKYPWEHQPVKHLILEIIMILSYTLAIGLIFFSIDIRNENVYDRGMVLMGVFNTLLITFLITAIHESVFFYRQWKLNFSKSAKLERDNISARYDALRTQVNPHFLFNSLNSLVTLVDGNQAAVNYIQSLSELLRYMLKSNEKELVLLREELLILKHYVGLQEMRFKENLSVMIDVPEQFCHFALPPLSLQMLVENAIKHNVVTASKPLKIKVWAEGETVSVVNNLQSRELPETTGKGLQNITGRYKLFTSRSVNISSTNSFFTVTLPLLKVEL